MYEAVPLTPNLTKKSKVAAVYTTPATVMDDIERAMSLAGYQEELQQNTATLLKVNISWQHYYPACSTSPWQLEGVIKTLQKDDCSFNISFKKQMHSER